MSEGVHSGGASAKESIDLDTWANEKANVPE